MIRRRLRAHLPAEVPPAAWLVIIPVLVWHAPAMVLNRAHLAAARVQHAAVLLAVDVLFALRRDRTARNLLAATIRAARRELRELDRQIQARRR